MILALRLVFCTNLRAYSDFCVIHHELMGFFNRGGKCLQRGSTDSLYKQVFITAMESVYSVVRTDS
jgi:hypothetical protein